MSHKAIVAKITEVIEIAGADKIQVAKILGENVIVSKSAQVGDTGIFFPVELQLSEEFCRENNLFRHANLNKDSAKTGYFDDNRKVRAQPMRGVRSEGLFMPFESLSYTGVQDFTLGQEFDELNGKPICCKYVSKATRDAIERAKKNGTKMPKKAETPYFEKHVDSAQFKHQAAMIPVGALIHIHAKIHGTSHRSGLTKVFKELPKWKKFVNKVAPVFPEFKWDFVVGTRNVIIADGTKEGFHGSEQFRMDVAETLKPFMAKGMTIYGEIAGYANGKPIMQTHNSKDTKDKAFIKKFGENIVYKYGCAEHEHRFHIYRITQLNEAGENVDYTQAQIEQWCKDRGFNAPLNVVPPFIYDGDLQHLMNLVEVLTENASSLGADYIDPSHPGEGVILRIDTGRMNPYFLKSKMFNFKVMESIVEAPDTEDVEAA